MTTTSGDKLVRCTNKMAYQTFLHFHNYASRICFIKIIEILNYNFFTLMPLSHFSKCNFKLTLQRKGAHVFAFTLTFEYNYYIRNNSYNTQKENCFVKVFKIIERCDVN